MLGRHCCRWTSLALGVFTVWAGLAADAVGQGNAATDRAALEAVYRATGGDDWTTNTNWLSDAPLEDWSGVEVTDGRVTGLRLGGRDESARRHVGNGLTGSLPAELGTLSQLRWVEIGGNSGLTGRIPAELGNLARLESLDLRWNWLTGSIPAALGLLTELEFLTLDGNALTGSIPAELSNLIDLRNLALGFSMLSGPLPSSMSRLSALDHLRLDGSGLCVPDSPAMQAWVAAIGDFTGVFCEGSVSFSRVVTQPGLGELDHVFAVADFNGDGLDDIVVGDSVDHDPDFTPADRLTKVPLHIFVSDGNGRFTHAPQLIDSPIEAHAAVVVTGDFNGDGNSDLVVYDHGAYVFSERSGYGNPPQLFLSGRDGVLHFSDDLANAVREQHEREPPYLPPAAPSDLHLKMATTGDLENDGDLDIWVESDGGNNMNSHFAVNNGDGTFTLDVNNRVPLRVLIPTPPPRNWRYHEALFMDVDHDGDLDLVLGQLRDPSRLTQFSSILVNDGTGHFPTRVELPHPAFSDGITRVLGIARFDLNQDGADDMLMLHTRQTLVGGWSGRFIQALLNGGDGTFVDETSTWILGDQSVTAPEPDYNYGGLAMHDIDLDGCLDLVVTAQQDRIRRESPLVYRNDGSGRLRAMSPVPFAGSDRYFGRHAMPADVNGDGAIDFVVPHRHPGPDRQHDTADDFTILVTLLNTTPPGPIRCGADPANRPPAPAGTLPNRTLAPDGTLTVDVSRAFADPDGDALDLHGVVVGPAGGVGKRRGRPW